MAVQSISRRVWYHWTYVALSSILSPDPIDASDASSLRTVASSDGIFYLQVICPLHDGTYVVRVAACPNLLTGASHVVLLSEAQLAQALPWDCRLQGKSAARISAILRAHGIALQKPSRHASAAPAPSLPSNTTRHTDRSEDGDAVALLPALISSKEVQQAIDTLEPPVSSCSGHRAEQCKACRHGWLELVVLRSVLIALQQRIRSSQDNSRHFFKDLERRTRAILVSHRRLRQRLVHVSQVYRNEGQVGWWVQVEASRIPTA